MYTVVVKDQTTGELLEVARVLNVNSKQEALNKVIAKIGKNFNISVHEDYIY